MPPNTFPSTPPSIPGTSSSSSSYQGPAYVQIPNLPLADGLDGSEQLENVQVGVSKRLTVSQLADYTYSSLPILPVPKGGTGTASFEYDGVLVGSGSSALRSTLKGGADTVLVANNGTPYFSDAIIVGVSIQTPLLIADVIIIDEIEVNNLIVTGSITDQALNVDSVIYTGTGGLLSTDATFTFIEGNLSVPATSSSFTGPIGLSTPSTGRFTSLIATLSISNQSLTSSRIIYSGVGGLQSDSPNLTFSGTNLTSSEFTGPIGPNVQNTGDFTALSANTGSFITSVSSNNVYATNLFPTEVVYAGTAGRLTSSALMFFDGASLHASFLGDLNGPVGNITPAEGTFTNLYGSTITTPNAQITGGSISGISSLIADDITATTSITDQALTPTRVVYSGTGGLLVDSANLTFSGTVLTTPQVISSSLHSSTDTLLLGVFDISAPLDVLTLTNTLSSFSTPVSILDYLTVSGFHAPLDTQIPLINLTYVGSPTNIVINFPETVPVTYNLNLPDTAGISGQPLLSGGGGTSSMFYGGITGNTSTFATASGSFVAGRMITTDVLGNFIDSGTTPSGVVNPGLANQMGYYSANGSTISGLSTANNGILSTDGTGIPSINTDPTISGVFTAGGITDTSRLGANRIPYTDAAGRFLYDGDLFFNGVYLEATDLRTPTLRLEGATSGLITIVSQSAAGTYTITMPDSAGSAGSPYLSGGGVGPLTYGSRSGNTTTFATTTGAFVAGHSVTTDASGNFIDSGSPASGIVNSGTINQIAYYAATGTSISGLSSVNSGILSTNGSGVPSINVSPTISGTLTAGGLADTSSSVNRIPYATTGGQFLYDSDLFFDGTFFKATDSRAGTLRLDGTSSGQISIAPQAASGTYTITLPNTAGTTGTPYLSGGGVGPLTYGALSGNTSTFATTTGSFVAGKIVTTDVSGNFIDSGLTPSSGNVNTGLINQMAYYAAGGSTVSGLTTANNGILITSAGGVPSISSTLPSTVQGNITSLGAVTSGSLNNVAIGGTTASSGRFSTLTATSLSSGSVPYLSTGGAFTTNTVLTYDGTTLSSRELRVSALPGGNITLAAHASTPTSTYSMILPTSGGTSGQPLLSSGGGGSVAMTYGTLQPAAGGTGTVTNTLNGVLYGNGTSAVLATTQGAANTILTANAGAPSFSAAPTIGTSVTTPLVIGGTTASSALTIESTSGAGTTDSIQFLTGSQVTRMAITSPGDVYIGQGEATASPVGGIIRAPNAVGTNIVGSDLSIISGVGTGTGGGGRLIFYSSPASTSGSTANALKPVMNISSSLGVRIGNTLSPASAALHLPAGTVSAGGSPLKLSSGTSMTTAESGSVEYDGTSAYLTNHSIRRTFAVGDAGVISAAMLTTSPTTFGTINVVTGENYIIEMEFLFTPNGNTVIVKSSTTSTNANNLSVKEFTDIALASSAYSTISAAGGSLTTGANVEVLRITGAFTATGNGTYGILLQMTSGTLSVLAGSYFKYTQF